MTESEFADLPEIARKQISGFEPDGLITPVEGGLLNRVFRISGKPEPVIAKYAPPYVSSNREIPLDPERLTFEAKALTLFRNGNSLHSLQATYLRVPQLIAQDTDHHILFLEDAGLRTISLDSLPPPESAIADEKLGTLLGEFIAGMHSKTAGIAQLAQNMNNAAIQKTRYMVQYQPAARYLLKAGIQDYEVLGRKLESLGRDFMKPGVCLIMGDLWPRSLIWNGESWFLIDWEFSHFGSPAQDTGHFLAHLWMLEQGSSDPEQGRRFSTIRDTFLKTYQEKIENLNPSLFTPVIKKQAVLHAAAEILARTTGAFQNGYVYAGLEPDDPVIQEAVQKAVEWILDTECSILDPG